MAMKYLEADGGGGGSRLPQTAKSVHDLIRGAADYDPPKPSAPNAQPLPYNSASVLSLGMGPISAGKVDRLLQSGQANAAVKDGQVYVSPSIPKPSYMPDATWNAQQTTEAQRIKEYERLSSYDLNAGQRQLGELERQLSAEKSKVSENNRRAGRRVKSAGVDSAAIGALQSEITQTRRDLQQAEYVQRGNEYAQLRTQPDFDRANSLGALREDNVVAKARDRQYWEKQMKHRNADTSHIKYKYMTDGETANYNYLLEKDPERAREYLDFMEEQLNYRMGKESGEWVNSIDNGAGRFLATTAYGIGAGLDQFSGGVRQLFSGDRLPTTATQYGSAVIRQGLGDVGPNLPDWMGGASLGQVGYDALTATANMAPSILLSTLTGGVAPAAVAESVGAASMGVSAAGNAYGRALAEGYTQGEARAYSTMVGASEAALQRVLGGISKMGGMSGKIEEMVSNIDTALLRISANTGLKMLAEGSEEYWQEILEPAYRNMFFGENNDIALWTPEATYSFLLGAITAGLVEGPSDIRPEVSWDSDLAALGKLLADRGLAGHGTENIDAALRTEQYAELVRQLYVGKVQENGAGVESMVRSFIGEQDSLASEWTNTPAPDRIDIQEVFSVVPEPTYAEMKTRAYDYRNAENNWGIISERIMNGEYNLRYKEEKYFQHIEGKQPYITATHGRGTQQSFLMISEAKAQAIVYRYAGKGEAKITRTGTVLGKEFVTTDIVVGKYYEKGEWHETRRVMIVYAKDGSHIVPVKER